MTGTEGFDFKTIKCAVASFLGCWALQQITGITVRNPLTVVFFVLLFCAALLQDKQSIVGTVISAALSAVMTFLLRNRIVEGFDSGIFKLLSLFIVFVGAACVFYIVIGFAISFFSARQRISIREKVREIFTNTKPAFTGTKAVVGIALICFLCWLPYYLYEYPGIMTADSLVQYAEFAGDEPLSNHHPIVHTLLIKMFIDIATIFHADHQVGIALYTVFQMLFMAIC